MASKQTCPKLLLFPFLAHGHTSPFLELAKHLSNHNFVVYFCSTPVNLEKIARQLADHSIIQVEYHLESSPELPPHYHTTTDLPHHLALPLLDALHKSGPVFSDILKSIQPDLVIHDINQNWIPHIPNLYDIPSIYYQVFCSVAPSYHFRPLIRPDLEFPSTGIFYREYEIASFEKAKTPPEYKDLDEDNNKLHCLAQSSEIILVRSSRALEEKYIDFQAVLVDKKMVPLGSLISEPEDNVKDDVSEIMQWLNGKDEASTVYVSFGSQIYLTKEELAEIALGLEMSNVNFIWVVRSPHGEKTRLEELLPEGFLDRTKGKGVVEAVWAPQTKILNHPSTGAFLSHCGWGSFVESINFGVPIIAMPVQYDQPLNARLVAELGIGVEVVGQETGLRNRHEIARVIREVVLKDEGEKMRRKIRELSMKMRVKSEEEIDAAVQELRRLCEKKNHEA